MSFRPIDTEYKGYKFRSRLEARWAVFFDEMGVSYQYEPEGFDLDGVRYLPDFHFTDGLKVYGEEQVRQNLWVEIKPTPELSDAERRKIAAFAKNTGYNLLLIAGEPGPEATLRLISYREQYLAPHVQFAELNAGVGLINLDGLDQLPAETRNAVANLSSTEPLIAAYAAARQERFESKYRTCANCGKRFIPYRDYHRYCNDCFQDEQVATASSPAAPLVRGPRTSTKSAPPFTISKSTYYLIAGIILIGVTLFSAVMIFDPFDWGLGLLSMPSTPTMEATLAPTAAPAVATETPLSTATTPAAMATTVASCSCSENTYNCSDFDTRVEAQACFDSCFATAGDIHILDEDGDREACESLP